MNPRTPRIHLAALGLASLMLLIAPAAPAVDTTTAQETFTLYQYQAGSLTLQRLDRDLQADPRFKEQGCETIGKKTPRYYCAKNDAGTQGLFGSRVGKGIRLNATTAACPTGCAYMRCPPPLGAYKCCNQTTYQPC
ncbi:MAG TPA: hypothetical protein PLL19_09425 [Thiobacillaceae bacterium]|nr:hypothetical protein [Thiobacillaceae bacterium]HNA83182.1 hypothetical protein [Thiobacillaceae bacterium]HNF89540.1 hypothetical protein [Thiobacillaceae bacterium]HNI08234.1 hypothetical protein [Thiobacillaceae bacterium]